MNLLKATLTPIILFICTGVWGQQAGEDNLVADSNIPAETHLKPPSPAKSAAPADPVKFSTLRHHKPIQASYSGYAIELTRSNLPLQRSYPLFQKFGNVVYDILADGQYSYCIIIPFTTEASVSQYLHTVVITQAPEAKIVTYKNGRRSGGHRK